MNAEDQDRLAYHLLGTCLDVEAALTALNISCSVENALDAVAEDVETCDGCGWWFEPSDLVGVDEDDGVQESGKCEDCRE